MIILDTLRADTLDLDATRPAPLPSLRAFSARSTAFVDAIAPAAWTPQSLPSILTGLTPPHTGCQGTPESGVPALPGGVTTLAERLRALGYVTSAFTGGGFVSASHGLAQGFDTFVSSFDTLGPEACLKTWSTRPAPAAPFFLLLHSYAPHDPYGEKDARALSSAAPPGLAPSPTIGRVLALPGGASGAAGTADVEGALREPGVLRECAFEWHFDAPARPANALLESLADPTKVLRSALRRFIDGGYLSDPRGRTDVESRFRTAYRSGLAPVDAMLVRTFAALDAARLPRDTIVIVTSDHGEAFGEHGYLTHERWLHDEIVRVPLLIRAPGRLPAGAVVRGTCGPVDLVPTLLELVGAPPSVEELDGRSLVAQAHGREGGHPVVSTADRFESVGGRTLSVREISVRDERRRWCYVYDLETGEAVSEHAFDLLADPTCSDPRPVGSLAWDEPELCRLLSACRDAARERFGLPLGGPICGLLR